MHDRQNKRASSFLPSMRKIGTYGVANMYISLTMRAMLCIAPINAVCLVGARGV